MMIFFIILALYWYIYTSNYISTKNISFSNIQITKSFSFLPFFQSLITTSCITAWDDFFPGTELEDYKSDHSENFTFSSGTHYVTNSYFFQVRVTEGSVISYSFGLIGDTKLLIDTTTFFDCSGSGIYTSTIFFAGYGNCAFQYICEVGCYSTGNPSSQCNQINNYDVYGTGKSFKQTFIDSCITQINQPDFNIVTMHMSTNLEIKSINLTNNHVDEISPLAVGSIESGIIDFCSIIDNKATTQCCIHFGVEGFDGPIKVTKCNINNNNPGNGPLFSLIVNVEFRDCCIINNAHNGITGTQTPFFVNCSTDISEGFQPSGDSSATAAELFIHQYILNTTGKCQYISPGIPYIPTATALKTKAYRKTYLRNEVFIMI